MLFALLMTTGCGEGSYEPPSTESMIAIENVGKWFQLFRSANGGKQPADEEEFLAFVNGKLTERGQNVVSRQELLTSPRDNESYVVLYGKPNSRSQELNLVVYEKTGANGTRLIATELGRSREVDESELQSLLSGSGIEGQ